MKSPIFITIAAAAGLATAATITLDDATQITHSNAGTPTTTYTFDLSGIQFNDTAGSLFNESLSLTLGGNQIITGIGWDISLSTVGLSWASEATMLFNTDFHEGLILNVAADDFSVTNQHYSSNVIDLTDNGIENFQSSAPIWTLDIEFFDSFVDNAGTGDAFFEEGSLIRFAVINMPAPNTLALLGLGGLTLGRRRR